MSFTGYAFDIYPYNDPNGTRLVRLTPAKGLQLAFRQPEQGFGMADGQIVIHSAHGDATAANFHKHNLVKVVDIATDTKVGGFFLEEGDFAALSANEEGGRLLTFRGPNTTYYLERAILREEPFSENPAAGTTRGDVDVDPMWTWSAVIYAGAVMVRAMEEGFYQPGPSGTSSDAPLADATWDFTRLTDSNGNAWDPLTSFSSTFQFRWGTSVLDLLISLQRGGLFWRSGADLDYHAYAADPTVDRTSATFAADKVRFAAGFNIATEVSRDITASVERTAVLMLGSENATAYVTGGSSDVTWIGTVEGTTTAYGPGLEYMGSVNLDDREVIVERAFPLRHIVADDELNGGYVPFRHYEPGDLVTIHTGTNDHDFNNFAIPVAAVRILHDQAGNWFGMPELGAQSLSAESKAFEERVNRIIHQPGGHSHPIPYCQALTGIRPTVQASGWTSTSAGAIAVPSGLTDSILVVFGQASGNIGLPWTASYGASAMTAIPDTAIAGGTESKMQAFYLLNPAAEGPNLSVIDGNGNQQYKGWIVLSGVNQSSPIGTAVTDSGTGTTGGPGTIPGTASSAIFLNAAYGTGGSTPSVPTPDGSQTSAFTQALPGFWAGESGGGYSSANPTWTFNSSKDWVAIGVAVNGSGTSGGRHPDLTGTETSLARCDHGHVVHSTGTPGVNDDETAGFVRGDQWAVVDDATTPTEITAVYTLFDASEGAAVWLELPSGGAPTDATYLVTTAHADLSAEVVVGATPGGELGGTWASPTVDATHAGSTHSAATDAHISDATDAHDASAISIADAGGHFTGTDVEAALQELGAGGGGASALDDLTDVDTTTTPPVATDVLAYDGSQWVPTAAGTPAAHASSHEDGGADEVEIANLPTSETDTAKVLHPDGAGGVAWGTDATGAGGGGVSVPVLVQRKVAGTSAASITLDSTPTAGNSIILFLDMFSTGGASAVTATNITFTKMVGPYSDAGGAKYEIWVGVVGASPGSVITITHPNSFNSCVAIEIEDALTPTAGVSSTVNTTAVFLGDRLSLTGAAAGSLIAVGVGPANTGSGTHMFPSGPAVGVFTWICGLVVLYADANGRAFVDTYQNGAGGAVMVEVT